jgi:hemolysin activation/secretion protein
MCITLAQKPKLLPSKTGTRHLQWSRALLNVRRRDTRFQGGKVRYNSSAQSTAKLGALSLLTFATMVLPGQALAQSASGTTPTRDQIDPLLPPEPQDRPRLSVEGDVERAPCSLADPAYANVKINFTGAVFNNLGPVSPAEMASVVQPYLGGEHPISIVCDIRDAAATKLRDKGYLAAVQVPVQRIENGQVKFEVLYARITTIRVMGEAGPDGRLLEKYLGKLVSDQPFNRLTAERSLLLAQDLPGYDIRLALRPAGTGAGDMVGEVRVNQVPVIADLSIQNLASRSTGRFGAQARVQFNGLTGHGDRTTFAAYTTADFSEQQVYQVGHDMLIGSNGFRIGGRATYALTRPDLGANTPPVRGRTAFATLEASYPLIRSQALSISAAGGMEFLRQRIRFAGLPLSRDRLRIAYAKVSGEAVDLKGVGPSGTIGWRLRGSLEARQGLSILGASPNCIAQPAVCNRGGFVPPSLPDGDPTATVLRFTGEAELRTHSRFTVLISPRAQLSSNALPAFEQFSAGNYTLGRGFDPGALVGDSGAGFQTEIRLDNFRLNPKSSLMVQPYAFSDNVWVWNKGVPGDPARMSSLGGGARFTLPGRARLDLFGAVPTRKLPGDAKRRDVRFLMTLTTNILPWRNR